MCRGNYEAVLTTASEVYPWNCVKRDELNSNYLDCIRANRPDVIYEKHYQVVWEKDLTTDPETLEYLKSINLNDQTFTVHEGEMDKGLHALDMTEIAACQNKITINIATDANCVRLLASYHSLIQEPENIPINFTKVYYRGIVKVKRITDHPTEDRVKATISWNLDHDYLRSSLMWSFNKEYGPWNYIPLGCPLLVVTPKPPVVTECKWYHKIGQDIRSVANFSHFTGDSGSVYQEVTNSTENNSELTDAVSRTFDDDNNNDDSNTNTNGPNEKDPLQKCLLKKLETISKTANVQCLFDGMKEGLVGGWTEGLPTDESGNPIEIRDCKSIGDAVEHGENCYQTIRLKAESSNITVGCADFVNKFNDAGHYTQCIERCGEHFKYRSRQYAFGASLHTGADKFSKKDETFEDDRELKTQEQFRHDWEDLSPGSYKYCLLKLWDDNEVCWAVDADKKVNCKNQCQSKYIDFISNFVKFRESADDWYKHILTVSLTRKEFSGAFNCDDDINSQTEQVNTNNEENSDNLVKGELEFKVVQDYYERVLQKLNWWRAERRTIRVKLNEAIKHFWSETYNKNKNHENFSQSNLDHYSKVKDQLQLVLDAKKIQLHQFQVEWEAEMEKLVYRGTFEIDGEGNNQIGMNSSLKGLCPTVELTADEYSGAQA